MVYTENFDQNPTAEFNDYCIGILRRWESGVLPFKEAVALISGKQQEAASANHLANQGRAEHLLGYLQHFRGDLNTSIRHYERARQLFQRVGNAQRMAMMDLNNGENYRLKGDFSRARRLYRTAHEAAQKYHMVNIQAMALVNEGLTLLAINQHEMAHKILHEALTVCDQWTDNPDQRSGLLCELHHGLTRIYLLEGKLDHAWESAQCTLQYAEQTIQKMQLGLVYRDFGDILTRMKTPPADSAFSDPDEYFHRSLEVFRELNMEAEMARTIYAQALSMAERGRKMTAARKLQQVMIMFTTLGMIDDAAKAAEAQLTVI